jgi:hypothetical protein
MTDEAAPDAPTKRSVPRWRRIVSMILIILGAFLVPISTIAVFARNQVLNTGRFVDTMSPLARNTAVQEAAATRITNAVMDNVPIEDTLKDDLPPRIAGFAPAVTGAVRGFVQTTALKVVQSQQFQKIWDDAIRLSHSQVANLLTGNTGAFKVVNGEVQLDLGQLLTSVKQALVSAGLTVVEKLDTSKINTKLTLFQAKNLETAQTGTDLLQKLAIVLPILMIACFVVGVVLAEDRRRALIRVGFGVAIGAALLSVALAFARSIYLNAVSSFVLSQDAAKAVFDTVVRNVKTADRVFILIGLLIVIGAVLAGPSVFAVRTRVLFRRGATSAGQAAISEPGPVTKWIAAHVALLRALIVALAVLVLVASSQPGPWTVFWLAIFVLIAFGVVEALARAAAPREPAS